MLLLFALLHTGNWWLVAGDWRLAAGNYLSFLREGQTFLCVFHEKVSLLSQKNVD